MGETVISPDSLAGVRLLHLHCHSFQFTLRSKPDNPDPARLLTCDGHAVLTCSHSVIRDQMLMAIEKSGISLVDQCFDLRR